MTVFHTLNVQTVVLLLIKLKITIPFAFLMKKILFPILFIFLLY